MDERERQRRSFAYGNVALSNLEVTKELVDQVGDRLAYIKGINDANAVMQWFFSKLDEYDHLKDTADEKIKELIDKAEAEADK